MADLSEPVAELIEEPLGHLSPEWPQSPLIEFNLIALFYISEYLRVQRRGELTIDDAERHLEVVEEAARVEVVAANRRPNAIDGCGLRVKHSLRPLEDANAEPEKMAIDVVPRELHRTKVALFGDNDRNGD